MAAGVQQRLGHRGGPTLGHPQAVWSGRGCLPLQGRRHCLLSSRLGLIPLDTVPIHKNCSIKNFPNGRKLRHDLGIEIGIFY